MQKKNGEQGREKGEWEKKYPSDTPGFRNVGFGCSSFSRLKHFRTFGSVSSGQAGRKQGTQTRLVGVAGAQPPPRAAGR